MPDSSMLAVLGTVLLAHQRRVEASERTVLELEADATRNGVDTTQLAAAVATAIAAHGAFSRWADEIESCWPRATPSYSPPDDAGIAIVRRRWFGVHCRLLGLVGPPPLEGPEAPDAARLRGTYVERVSIEWMDHGPLPEHLSRLAFESCRSRPDGA